MAKKLILIPKQDFILICLPPEWVGKPLACTLAPMVEREMVSQVSERAIQYQADRFRHRKNERRPRKKRLRQIY